MSKANPPVRQVEDDPSLLDLMIADVMSATELFRLTNYWAVYAESLVPELKRLGLRDFRRRRGSVLGSFGAVDLSPEPPFIELRQVRWLHNRFSARIPGWTGALDALSRLLTRVLPVLPGRAVVPLWGVNQLAFTFARAYGEKTGAHPICDLHVSLVGNPEAVFEVEGRPYTTAFLTHYMRYGFMAKHFDFADDTVIVELASGSGKLAELLHKVNPRMTILLFDIPPQLYVAEQYLKAVFPGEVVSYRETRDATSLEGLEKGRIYCFGNWKFDLLDTASTGLFISSTSFAEMEPEVTRNYLRYVNRSARNVYLNQLSGGKGVARRKGLPGVLNKTVFAHYEEALTDFTIVERSRTMSIFGQHEPGSYEESFWKRKA